MVYHGVVCNKLDEHDDFQESIRFKYVFSVMQRFELLLLLILL